MELEPKLATVVGWTEFADITSICWVYVVQLVANFVCCEQALWLKKVKFSHTRYRALGPELIPMYRQSARR